MRRIAGFLVRWSIALVGLVALGSCSEKEQNFDLAIKEPADLAKFQQLESSLRITPDKAADHQNFQVFESIPVPYLPEYRLGPGDVIEIVYHISYGKTSEEYRIEVQDKVSIHFPYHPQFSTTVLVRTDGKITMPIIGDTEAEALTPGELAAHLNGVYRKYLQNPSITVALEEFNVKINELKKAITTAPRGQSKIAPIAVDGRISFPLIGNMQAEGLTLVQLEKIVNDKYSVYVRNLKTTLIALEIHHPKIYVLGEVSRPGAYPIQNSINILDAMALAGGHTKDAYLGDIVVIRNDGLERPLAFKLDIESLLKRGETFANIAIKPADIIYFPKTKIASTNDLLEKVFTRGIYSILPFSTVFSFGVKDLGGDYKGP